METNPGALQILDNFWQSTFLANPDWKALVMIVIGLIVLYLGVVKKFEPVLLVPIGFGVIFSNIPGAMMFEPNGNNHLGPIGVLYDAGIANVLFPLLILLGIGALTDFGPLIASPFTAMLGAAAQFGIFATLFIAVCFGFTIPEAISIGIIGAADGPTAIYTASKLAPNLMGPIAVAAYSYMALVPVIQPPIIRMLTTKAERKIRMKQVRYVGKRERIAFPIVITILTAIVCPYAVPLIGFMMLGNFLKECAVVDRLAETSGNALANIVTIFLGICVGATMKGEIFLQWRTIGIFIAGIFAFAFGTFAGVMLGKLMSKFSKTPINPMIGAAGISALPMSSRVVQQMVAKEDPGNFLLMHAMGANVSGQIGSAIAAGILLSMLGKIS